MKLALQLFGVGVLWFATYALGLYRGYLMGVRDRVAKHSTTPPETSA